MSIYKPHSIKIFPDALGSAVILQSVLNQGLELAPEHRAEVTAAESSPGHVALVSQKPKFSAATYDLANLLTALGVSGLCVKSATNPGIVSYWQKFDACGTPASGTVHRSYTGGNGLIYPKSLKIDHRGDARIEFEFDPISSDGASAPITISDTATLPTITAAHARWTLGKIIIGNKTLTDYTGLEIDFGNTVETRGSASAIYDQYVEGKTHAAKITITGIDPTWFSSTNIPIGGIASAVGTDVIYLRKRGQSGTNFVADATAEHIKFTPAGLANVAQASRAEMQRASETTLVITCSVDASGNAGLAVNTATAIT